MAGSSRRTRKGRTAKRPRGPKRSPRTGRTSPAGELKIRMYNVGFGDAFLLWLPTPAGTRTMLVDCGQHLGGIANRMNAVLDDLIAAVTVDGVPRIDVVVATHRHFDHVSGFDSAKWKDVRVGEVWLPWTEKRGDLAADRIRQSQKRIAAALRARFGTADTHIGWLALNSFGNAGAERTLLQGFAGAPERRYLPARERAQRTFTTPLLPGVTVHALGPSFDPDVIATLEPDQEQVFRLLSLVGADGPSPADATTAAPPSAPLFARRHVMDAAAFAAGYRDLAAHAESVRVTKAAAEDLLQAASGVEDAINGTSLMLVFEIGDQCLLFAGDSEWGTWSKALADAGWRELLGRTTVYKVSHHGSYNGTPKGFVDDLLAPGATSLMSFRHVEKWPSIPRESLVEALAGKQRTLIRSDKIPANGGGISRNGTLWVELAVPVRR